MIYKSLFLPVFRQGFIFLFKFCIILITINIHSLFHISVKNTQ